MWTLLYLLHILLRFVHKLSQHVKILSNQENPDVYVQYFVKRLSQNDLFKNNVCYQLNHS